MTRLLFPIFVLVCTASAVWGEPPRFQRGDSNLDGKFDLSDAAHTLGYLFLGRPRSVGCQDASDSNDDGTLDLTDAVHSLGFLFLGAAPLPPPFEECGWDPSRDGLECEDFLGCEQPPPGGDGLFSAAVSYGQHDCSTDVALGDLNGDSALDLATASWCGAGVKVRLGMSEGTLGEPVGHGGDFGLQSVAIGDVDGDGDLDLAAANSDTFPVSVVSVLLGAADGSFAEPVSYPLRGRGAYAVELGDLNADGALDLAVASQGNYGLCTLLGVPNGGFGEAAIHGVRSAWSLALGDVDRDGALDVAVTYPWNDTVPILLGLGDGTFSAAIDYRAGDNPHSIVFGDLDDNGALDLVVANVESNDVSILLGAADGTLGDAFPCGAGDAPRSPALGDVDGDGTLDLTVTNEKTNGVSTLLGVGDGAFHQAVGYRVGESPRALSLGDVDGDGTLDLAVGNFKSDDVSILLRR